MRWGWGNGRCCWACFQLLLLIYIFHKCFPRWHTVVTNREEVSKENSELLNSVEWLFTVLNPVHYLFARRPAVCVCFWMYFSKNLNDKRSRTWVHPFHGSNVLFSPLLTFINIQIRAFVTLLWSNICALKSKNTLVWTRVHGQPNHVPCGWFVHLPFCLRVNASSAHKMMLRAVEKKVPQKRGKIIE